MSADEIQNLDELLGTYLGQNKKITAANISRLTAYGENYGSILLKVDLTLKDDKNGTEEELHAVAKRIPTDEFFRMMFNVQESCKVEIGFYDTVVPTLQQFQKEKGVHQVMDFFPKMYAHRINLNGSDKVDDDAVLLLENVKEEGYNNVSRFKGFDLPTAKLVLRDLAAFHAVPLALKILEPATFQSKIKPYLEGHIGPPSGSGDQPPISNTLFDFLETVDECKFAIPRLQELEKTFKMGRPRVRNEPFVSIGHGDLWVNNIMTKFENGKPVANIFIDFQGPDYQSPALDLFFLLWSSVQKDVLEHHFDELVRFYHDRFLDNLRQLDCDASFFSMEVLLEELRSASKREMMHVLFMTAYVIFYKAENGVAPAPHERKVEDIPNVAREKIKSMLRICNKKGWL